MSVKAPSTVPALSVSSAAFPLLAPDGSAAAPSYSFANYTGTGAYSAAPGTYRIAVLGVEQITVGNGDVLLPSVVYIGSGNVQLHADAAAVLALKNGTTAQTLRVYGTTSGSKYLSLSHDASDAFISSTAGGLYLQTTTAANVGIITSGSVRWQFNSSGHIAAQDDNTYDLGASGASRPRTGYFGTSVVTGAAGTSNIKQATTLLSAVSGATVTATSLIPDGAFVLGVVTRVTTQLGNGSGTTGYQVGDGSDADRWGSVTGLTVGTDTDNTDATASFVGAFTSANNVVITANGGNFDGTGAIRVTVLYIDTTAPAS